MATLLAVIFFIVSLALPWYGIAERTSYGLPGGNTTGEGDLISSFYWSGYIVYINPSTWLINFYFYFSTIISINLFFFFF
jgi:hypothetical protein